MTVPTVSPVWLRHLRHVSTPGRVEMWKGSPLASQRGQTNPFSQRAFSKYSAQAASSGKSR